MDILINWAIWRGQHLAQILTPYGCHMWSPDDI